MALTLETLPQTRDSFLARKPQDSSLNNWPKFLFRAVRSSDKALIEQGLETISPESRYMRFFSSLNKLSEPLLKHFTHVDHFNHEAIGVLDISTDPATPAAIARYIRTDEEDSRAEFAVTVVDRYQSRGPGQLLLAALLLCARQRGIDHFWCQVQVDNQAMRALGAPFGAVEKLVPEIGLLLDISTHQGPHAVREQEELWRAARHIVEAVA